MYSKNPSQRLTDIVDSIEAITRFTAGMTFERFTLDRKTVYAVTRALEIISEASRRLPEELKQRHSQIDWIGIAAAGNVYRHECEVVDDALVWQTVQNDLRSLSDAARTELQRLSGESG